MMKMIVVKEMRNKKYSFSLLEILIALSIISLLASLFSFKILDLIKDYKFKKTVEMLKEDLTRIKVLCITHQCDCDIKIYKSKNNYYFSFSLDWQSSRPLVPHERKLEGVKSIKLNHKKISSLTMRCHSSGVFQPQVALGFFQKLEDQSESLWIDLRKSYISCSQQLTPLEPLTFSSQEIEKFLAIIDK